MDHYNLFSSDSSSSDTDDEEVFINIIAPEVFRHRQKTEKYFEDVVPNYNEEVFVEHFRISRNVHVSLHQKFKESEYYPRCETGNERITPAKCVLIYCWYVGHEAASFRDVADRFDISISTLHIIIKRVTLFLSNMAGDVIRWPADEEAEEIERNFNANGFPGVIGCMDGTHIRIDKPSEDPDSYINRHKYYSVQMQMVCDHKRVIRDVFIGYPGSVHDSRVFRTSPLYRSLQVKCGDKVILADSAYPCLRNVLTPYRDNGHLTVIERSFNEKLSKCRIVIEHAFGILKQKFRQLYHLKLRHIQDICHFIRACCVLHNLSIENNINVEMPADGNVPNLIEDINEEQDTEGGHEYRNYVAALLHNQ